MQLYTFWRSSAAYRARIALNLKNIGFEAIPVHLTRDGGEQLKESYRSVNPNALLPALRLDDGSVLTQSLAIVEYLDECHPDPALLPRTPLARAHVRAAALQIACDIHPLNNLRVAQYLRNQFGRAPDDVVVWMRHWMASGLRAYAALIEPDSAFSFGDAPTLADLCLVPQLYNARRWGLDMTSLGHLERIDANCRAIDAFARAQPEHQPDAE
jgi:maleylacetoacetate isomerase